MIHLVVRKTTEWNDADVFRAQIPEGFAPMVELWDATFTIPYPIFRRELKRIAMLSWSRVADAACVALADVPPDGLVVPTDDDDWFAPGLGSALAAAVDRTHLGYHWPSRFLEVPIDWRHRLGRWRRRLFPGTPPLWICTTNNYAVLRRPETDPLAMSHMAASRWFVAHPAAVKTIAEPLSIMNRTLASRTTLSLAGPLSRRQLLRKRREYERVYRRPLAPELAWCEPYVASMRALMDALRLRS